MTSSSTPPTTHRLHSDLPAPASYTGNCLLPQLQAIRQHCLHPLIDDKTAARLLQTSHSVAACLLPGYAFVEHVFDYARRSAADVQRSLALYARYGLRILRMGLPDWNEPLMDSSESWLPVLPASLIALTFCRDYGDKSTIAHVAFNGTDGRWAELEEEEADGAWESQSTRLVHRWEDESSSDTCRVYSGLYGVFNQPIPASALPVGLRFLELSWAFNQRLREGSIPDTVEVLQFGPSFNHELLEDRLPASLTHLVFGRDFNHSLQPGVLPAGLRQLHLGGSYNQPLSPGVLPARLQRLDLGYAYDQPLMPGAIPASVTHLRFSSDFTQPLQLGSIPHSVVHLYLGEPFSQPLLRALLPASLRELVLSHWCFAFGLRGRLPAQLEVLAFHAGSRYAARLAPGDIPASVRVLSMGREYNQQLLVGSVPATVSLLRLPARPMYAADRLAGVVSPSTRVVWWKTSSMGWTPT